MLAPPARAINKLIRRAGARQALADAAFRPDDRFETGWKRPEKLGFLRPPPGRSYRAAHIFLTSKTMRLRLMLLIVFNN
jgi:hypothetical protein